MNLLCRRVLIVLASLGIPSLLISVAESGITTPVPHPPIEKAESSSPSPAIQWRGWASDLFTQATRDHKLVILDLEAVWCHWCHVMDEKTYHDPLVIREIKDHYIAVRVDQDSRPDIANRFEDFGWPATILFDSKGKVLARRSGFIEPTETLAMLKAFAADPTPGPSASDQLEIHFAASGPLSNSVRDEFSKVIDREYDYKLGGWKAPHKFLDTHLAEYFLRQALKGNKKRRADLEQALNTQLALLDPIWGGIYQYSAEGDWKHPHFEKIISIQADNLRAYALSLMDPQVGSKQRAKYLATTAALLRYLKTFLTSSDGTFYVSQDADAIPGQHAESYFALCDEKRRKQRMPKVDQHVYARENGWMISALLDLYAATGDNDALERAVKATKWIETHRRNGALFNHDEHDMAGPFLGDNVSMATAFLNLYQTTGEREWLKKADTLGASILSEFTRDADHPGLRTAAHNDESKPQFEENLRAAHFYLSMSYHLGKPTYKAAALAIFRFLASSTFQGGMYAAAPVLNMDDDLATPPLHIVVSGKKSDPQAKVLFKAAIAQPRPFKIIEWWDQSEGPLPNPDESYPVLEKAAAFVCAEHRCSFPASRAQDIPLRVKQLTGD